MNLCLEFCHDPERPPIELKRSVLLVGRHPECDVRINLSSISRRHCCLAQVDDSMIVRDLGSRHGVWVNGRRVDEKVLKTGDQLAIGPMIFKINVIKFDHDHIQGNASPNSAPNSRDELEEKTNQANRKEKAIAPDPDPASNCDLAIQGSIQDTSSNPEQSIDQFWQNLGPAESSAPEFLEDMDLEDAQDESEIGPGLGLKL